MNSQDELHELAGTLQNVLINTVCMDYITPPNVNCDWVEVEFKRVRNHVWQIKPTGRTSAADGPVYDVEEYISGWHEGITYDIPLCYLLMRICETVMDDAIDCAGIDWEVER